MNDHLIFGTPIHPLCSLHVYIYITGKGSEFGAVVLRD